MHPKPSEVLAFKLRAEYKLDGASPVYSRECDIHVFQKRISNFNFSDHRTVLHFPWSILNEHWLREEGYFSGSCSQMASFLSDGALT